MRVAMTSDARIKQLWAELNRVQEQFGVNSLPHELAMSNLRQHMKNISCVENTYYLPL
ncbi:MAG: hypothetical protein ACO4AU_15325 [bacterium]|jgi:hypothetical protein